MDINRYWHDAIALSASACRGVFVRVVIMIGFYLLGSLLFTTIYFREWDGFLWCITDAVPIALDSLLNKIGIPILFLTFAAGWAIIQFDLRIRWFWIVAVLSGINTILVFKMDSFLTNALHRQYIP